jgi:hypothetical protein
MFLAIRRLLFASCAPPARGRPFCGRETGSARALRPGLRRPSLHRGAGIAGDALAGVSTRVAGKASSHRNFLELHMSDTDDLESCLQSLNDCADACDRCASACLDEEDVSMMARCVALDTDCATVCRATAALLARDSTHASAMCKVCADLCRDCGNECLRHEAEHCQVCAAACRQCADACQAMAAIGN